MKKAVVLATLLVCASIARADWCDAGEDWELIINGRSHHPHKRHPFHEVNLGLGAMYYLNGCPRWANVRTFAQADWVHPNSVGGTFYMVGAGAQWRPDFAQVKFAEGVKPLQFGLEAVAGEGSYSIPLGRDITIRRPIFIPGIVAGWDFMTVHVEYLGKPRDLFSFKEAKAYFLFVSYRKTF